MKLVNREAPKLNLFAVVTTALYLHQKLVFGGIALILYSIFKYYDVFSNYSQQFK